MNSPGDMAEVLLHTGLFESASASSREAVAQICLPKMLRKKQVLFRQGDKGMYLYVLVSGSVQLSKANPDGKEVVIKVVKAGEMFAEAILFERSTYPVDAVALKTSQVYQIPRHQFTCLLENAGFRNEFIANLFQKMRFLASRIQYLTTHGVEARLILFLREQFGKSRQIVPNMSRKDIAAAIGATPETFSRLLGQLKKSGTLRWEGTTITVSDDMWGE